MTRNLNIRFTLNHATVKECFIIWYIFNQICISFFSRTEVRNGARNQNLLSKLLTSEGKIYGDSRQTVVTMAGFPQPVIWTQSTQRPSWLCGDLWLILRLKCVPGCLFSLILIDVEVTRTTKSILHSRPKADSYFDIHKRVIFIPTWHLYFWHYYKQRCKKHFTPNLEKIIRVQEKRRTLMKLLEKKILWHGNCCVHLASQWVTRSRNKEKDRHEES